MFVVAMNIIYTASAVVPHVVLSSLAVREDVIGLAETRVTIKVNARRIKRVECMLVEWEKK